MDLVTILIIIIFILLMKIDNDKIDREERRAKGRHKAMLRRGWKVSPDSQDGEIIYYKTRRRKRRN